MSELDGMDDMSCDEFAEVAAELALGVLTGRERARALAHLDGCESCREQVRELSMAGDELLALLPPAEPPAGFESRVLERIGLTVPGQPDAWDKCGHYVDDAGNIQLICGGYLLRAGDRIVLIDAGLGEYEDEQWHGGQFLDSLRGLGVTPAEVTDVVFTHLHWDHVGWATRQGEVVFSNATYRAHRADWAHFVEGPDADPEDVQQLSPLAGRLDRGLLHRGLLHRGVRGQARANERAVGS